jgi:DNA-binding transcriptional LysR family regulator
MDSITRGLYAPTPVLMTYDQLVAFLAVAGEGTFTAASAALHKSQPAVSKLVRNLEGELGVQLFDRAQYRATLTDAGRLFHERAVSVIESSEALKTFGMQLGGRIEPIVRLAVEAVTPLAPVMQILRAAQQRYPTVRIELATERLAGAADALREGRADLAVATKLGIDAAKLEFAHFRSVRILPVARADHPLAAAAVPVPRGLLRAHAQIVLRDSAHGADSPSLNVFEGGLRWSVTDVAAKREVILAGMGWGGLPEHVVADELASGELVALQVPEFEVGVMELFAMRRRDRAFGVVASALWEEISRSGAEAAGVMHARKRGRGTNAMASKRTDTNRRPLNNTRRR